MQIQSKIPSTGISIFSIMSSLANECNAINLSQGFPGYDCDPLLKHLVYKFMKMGKNQYAPMPGVVQLREAISSKVNKTYGMLVDPKSEITITSGATQAIFTAITAIIRSGDEAIIFEPAYDSYMPSIKLNGGIAVSIALKAPDFSIDWKEVRSKVTARTKLIIINSPHNPCGRILSAEDLQALKDICEEYDLILLSDEVYEHIVFDGKSHESILTDSELFDRSFTVFSFGKVFHNTGWKMGYCIAPEYLMKEFRKVHQYNVFSSNAPTQYALAEYLDNPEHYLELPHFFQEKRDLFINILDDTPLVPLQCDGTYFLLCSYKNVSDKNELEFAKWMCEQYRVASIPISPFYEDGTDQKLIRFCFAKNQSELEEAGKRLSQLGASD
jgi:methionine aminotransferase